MKTVNGNKFSIFNYATNAAGDHADMVGTRKNASEGLPVGVYIVGNKLLGSEKMVVGNRN